jgi:hypothetical protein
LERGRTREDREKLSAVSGVAREELLERVKLSDLARIRGLGGAFVRLFYDAGGDTIETLSRWDHEGLTVAARRVNLERRSIFGTIAARSWRLGSRRFTSGEDAADDRSTDPRGMAKRWLIIFVP